MVRWVYGICRHKVVDWFRRMRREVPRDLESPTRRRGRGRERAARARWTSCAGRSKELPEGEENEQDARVDAARGRGREARDHRGRGEPARPRACGSACRACAATSRRSGRRRPRPSRRCCSSRSPMAFALRQQARGDGARARAVVRAVARSRAAAHARPSRCPPRARRSSTQPLVAPPPAPCRSRSTASAGPAHVTPSPTFVAPETPAPTGKRRRPCRPSRCPRRDRSKAAAPASDRFGGSEFGGSKPSPK